MVTHSAQPVGFHGNWCERQRGAEEVHGRGPVEGIGGAFLYRPLCHFDGMGDVAAGGREGRATASGTAGRGVKRLCGVGVLRGCIERVC